LDCLGKQENDETNVKDFTGGNIEKVFSSGIYPFSIS
jgi:hypothetical protein